MAKKQSRRSVSINRVMFDQVHGIALAHGVPLSVFTEAAFRHFILTPGVMSREFQAKSKTDPTDEPSPRPRNQGLVTTSTIASVVAATAGHVFAPPVPEASNIATVSALREALDRGLGRPAPPPPFDPDAPIDWRCKLHNKEDCENRVSCPRPTCSLCVETIKVGSPIFRRPFGRDDAMVLVCQRCDTEHPNSGGYSLGSGVSRGVGEGNKHRGGGHT